MKKGSAGLIFTPFGITQLIMVAAMGAALWLAYGPWRLERAREEIRHRYPIIPLINQASLIEWLNRREGDRPILIDVRPKGEYDFSHLPGAKSMAPSATPAALGFSESADVAFVIYDTFGADSCAVATSLAERGYKRMQVLDGGVFDWANNGMPLEGPDGIGVPLPQRIADQPNVAGEILRHG